VPTKRLANRALDGERVSVGKKKSLKVDRNQFEGIVKNLLNTKPIKREKVKTAKKKPAKLFPPTEPQK
jgi:hypothetical protein